MSDADKPSPDSPSDGDPGATPSPAANVISIEQARAELLGKRRARATPPQGAIGRARARGREVPAPVTLPPGEHSAVIVTDTPAARAHIDKKTVHPGEAPGQTHEKKVRVKTHLDPRRAKTQLTERRAGELAQAEADSGPVSVPAPDDEMGSLWSRPSQPEGVATPQRPSRPSLARGRPVPREHKLGAPLFVIGIAIAAAIGAIVVFMLGRQGSGSGSGKPPLATVTSVSITAPATTASVAATASVATAPSVATTSAPTATAASTDSAPATGPASASAPATTSGTGASAPPVVKSTGPATKPATTPSPPASATAKPTATSVLPFGKEEN